MAGLDVKHCTFLISTYCIYGSVKDLWIVSKEIMHFFNYYLFSCMFTNFFFCRDLSKINGLKNIIIESFNHNSEEVKSAASYALGNISLGNLGDYVPFVLKEIEAQPKRQYLLLHSLKEVSFFLFFKFFFPLARILGLISDHICTIWFS